MEKTTDERIRKLLIRDSAGNELRIETDDASTLAQLENIYRNRSGFGSGSLLFADTRSRRMLGDKRDRIGDIWPNLGDIEIIAIPDTVNA